MGEHDITGIAATAAQVAAQHGELESAIDAERYAEAAILERAIAAAKPALRAICSALRSRDTTTGLADPDKQRREYETHAERGLRLDGDAKAEREQSRADSGTYGGSALYLLDDGTLAERTWSGRWTRWQGGTDETLSTLRPVTPREAMDSWDLDDCIESLRAALEGQLTGKSPERAKAARARAEKLTAVGKLIG
jgi:hypothetical protein